MPRVGTSMVVERHSYYGLYIRAGSRYIAKRAQRYGARCGLQIGPLSNDRGHHNRRTAGHHDERHARAGFVIAVKNFYAPQVDLGRRDQLLEFRCQEAFARDL
jgi:hypothetical protein